MIPIQVTVKYLDTSLMQIYVRNLSQPMVIAQSHKIVWTPVYLSADGGEEMESVRTRAT